MAQRDTSQEKLHLISVEHLCSYSRITLTPSYQKATAAGGLSQVLQGVSFNRETAKKHNITLSGSQWKQELRKFW